MHAIFGGGIRGGRFDSIKITSEEFRCLITRTAALRPQQAFWSNDLGERRTRHGAPSHMQVEALRARWTVKDYEKNVFDRKSPKKNTNAMILDVIVLDYLRRDIQLNSNMI